MKGKVVIVMGSERDLEFSREVAKTLKTLGVTYEFRVASAHKSPLKVLEILKDATIQKRFHGPGYAFTYWIWNGRIFRQKLKGA